MVPFQVDEHAFEYILTHDCLYPLGIFHLNMISLGRAAALLGLAIHSYVDEETAAPIQLRVHLDRLPQNEACALGISRWR